MLCIIAAGALFASVQQQPASNKMPELVDMVIRPYHEAGMFNGAVLIATGSVRLHPIRRLACTEMTDRIERLETK